MGIPNLVARHCLSAICVFWDKTGDTLVIATHGLIKKTQKTPKSEIKKAQAIRKEYFDNKEK